MNPARPLLVAALAGTLSFAAVPLASAAFVDAAAAGVSFSTASLSPPSGLTVQKRCTLGLLGVVLAASLDLTWTPSSTTWATGQRVVVTDGDGVVVATQDLSATASSTTVDLPLVSGGTYTSTVRATYGGWTSAAATATTTGC